MAQDDKTPTAAEKGKGKLDDLKKADGAKGGGDSKGGKDGASKANGKEDGVPKEG